MLILISRHIIIIDIRLSVKKKSDIFITSIVAFAIKKTSVCTICIKYITIIIKMCIISSNSDLVQLLVKLSFTIIKNELSSNLIKPRNINFGALLIIYGI